MRMDGGRRAAAGGFLTRLARDRQGNVLAISAAAMIPLAGMVGGAIDLSRMYITKTRLQHACDAGALAGRRAMGAGSWGHNGNAARKSAEQFFRGNWADKSYGSIDAAVSFTETGGVVNGAVSVDLPMTLMRVVGATTQTIAVTCSAEQRLLNTDVMFVLDTTGSMAQTISGDARSKMDNLRIAVKCFYQTLAQLDVPDQTCEAGEPTGGVDNDVQLRFGFVPYSSNVNVGRLLNVNWVANSWSYQTRRFDNRHDWTAWSAYYPEKSGPSCPTRTNTPTTQYQNVREIPFNGRNYCSYEQRDLRPVWEYDRLPINVSGLKNGSGWNNSFTVPRIGNELQDETVTWDGCVEERTTVPQATYDPIPAGALDLDIDLVPTGDPATQWGPVLPTLGFFRASFGQISQLTTSEAFSPERYLRGPVGYACPSPSRRLRSYQANGDSTDFQNYVNALNPVGGTYHDIGMIWGQRLLSPTGLFAADNRVSRTGGAIERHLIFMTDGDTDTSTFNSGAYGIPWFDRRQTDPNVAPGDGDTDRQVDARFEALCTRGRQNFTIWVIGFGPLTNDTLTRLQNCASPARFFRATNGPELQNAFRQIAEQIGQLRVVK